MKVAICLGHSRKINGRIEGGAVSVAGVSEHKFNSELAPLILDHLSSFEIEAFIVSEYEGGGYTAAQKWLASYIKSRGATVAIELHFNSASPAATGHEWLFWASSANGRRLAKELDESMLEMFPDFKRRGVKALGSSDRGGEFLKLTHCPAVIAEPFFGSNHEDWREIGVNGKQNLAQAIAIGLRKYNA